MKKRICVAICAALAGFLILSSCPTSVEPEAQTQIDQYRIQIFPVPAHGTLRVSQDMASQGTAIKVYVNPDPGYTLGENGLVYKNEIAGGIDIIIHKIGGDYQFSLGSNNVTVTATFTPNTNPGLQTVSVDKTINKGVAYTDPIIAAPGTPVKIYLIPDAGYGLADGSLVVRDTSGNPVSGVTVSATLPHTFTMPSQDAVVSARFEEKDFTGLLANARLYLNAGQYDAAASFYEEAYKKRSGGAGADVEEVIFYSTLARLGSILIDRDVRALLGNGSLYMNVVPTTLDDWICDPATWTGDETQRWYQTWPGVQYDTAEKGEDPPYYVHTTLETEDATLPKLYARLNGSPLDFPTPFGDYGIAQGSNPDSRQKFDNLVFWMLLARNQSGFNGFVERVNTLVFGTKFEDAASRAVLPESARVPLYPGLKTRFGLDKYYGPGNTNVGKAELDYIFGILRSIKAAFEYLQAYDLTIDLRPWMTSEILPDDGLDQILNKMFALAVSNPDRDFWGDVSTVAKILPLKNNFLNMRDNSYLTRAKNDLSSALVMLKYSMEYWQGASSNFSAGAKADYRWAKDGVVAAKEALDGSGNFHFPKKLPVPGSSAAWPTSVTSDYAINFGQFFSPGAFSLGNLLTTENGGKAPSLFKIKWYEDRDDNYASVFTTEGVRVSAPITGYGGESNVSGNNSAPFGIYSFEINTENLRKIFPRGFEQEKYGVSKVDKAFFHQVFPTIPLWPTRPTYLMGTYQGARKLYQYYH
jgi:hypothetical protein